MWTPNLRQIERVNGNVKLVVDFTNGTEKATQEYTLSSPQPLKYLVKPMIDNLNALDTFQGSLNVGSIDITPDTVTPKTQAEKDLEQFLKDYSLWVKVKNNLIDTGILTGNEAQVVALKSKVQSEFKPAYINEL